MKYIINIDPRIKIKNFEEHCNVPVYIRFSGDFTEASAEKFCEELEAAEDVALKSGQEVIPVVINSYGGEIYALLAMIDMIKACKVPIATIVEGKAMSAGAALFCMGAEGHRYIGPNATVMIHEASSGAFGKNEEIKSSSAETDRLNQHMLKMMAKNCGKEENYFVDIIHEKKHADWYLDAKECLKHNIANVIGIPTFTVDFIIKQKFGI